MSGILCHVSLASSRPDEFYFDCDTTLTLPKLQQLISEQFSLEAGFYLSANGREIANPEQLTGLLSRGSGLINLEVTLDSPSPAAQPSHAPCAIAEDNDMDISSSEGSKPDLVCSIPKSDELPICHPEGKRIAGVQVSGFKDPVWNRTWERHDEDFNGQPAFRKRGCFGKLFHLYFREGEGWVIDDVILPAGPVFGRGKELGGKWDVDESWERDGNIKVSSTDLESVTVSGFPADSKENGTYRLVPGTIHGKPHYVLRKDAPNERHLFYSSAWAIGPKATDDYGFYAINNGSMLSRQWKTREISEQNPTFQMLAASEMPAKEVLPDHQVPQERCSNCTSLMKISDVHYQCITCKRYRICKDCEELNATQHFHEESHVFAKLRSTSDDAHFRRTMLRCRLTDVSGVKKPVRKVPMTFSNRSPRRNDFPSVSQFPSSAQVFPMPRGPRIPRGAIEPFPAPSNSRSETPSRREMAQTIASLERRMEYLSVLTRERFIGY